MVRKIDLNNFQVARSETARDINSRIMLNLVRKLQPISRASLARHSGLQRSTVSAITEQLIAEKWLKEGAMGHLPRGRKPKFLHLNEDRAGIIGINVRPYDTNLAVANLAGRFLVQESMPTARSSDQFVEEVSQRVRRLIQEHPGMDYEGIGVSLPGRVDSASERFVFAPNLGWHEEDLKPRLEQATGLLVEMENEANACALSEFWFGRHAEGERNLIAVAVSEGIGAGIVINGQLVRGSSGLAGEFGHVALDEEGPKCACGNRGCWEVYASNSAAVRYYSAATAAGRNSKSKAADLRIGANFEDILLLAEHGDLKAIETIDQMAHYLGLGIAMLVTGLAPDVIVVVGEVTRAWDRVGPIISEVVKQRSFTHVNTRIIASGPAPLPRLRGIIALVLQKHFGAPIVA
jgi:predicted NBD/HSP70 family sugar kinase